MTTPTRNVAVYLFDEVEVLDFAGPFEVFSTAARVASRLRPEAPKPFEVRTVGRTGDAVRARGGLRVRPEHDLDSVPRPDVLVVPGGVVTAELDEEDLLAWVRRAGGAAEITASVCTGAFVLARAGLLDGLRATTHWEDLDELAATFPAVRVLRGTPWVDEGRVVTSAGISAGIDMSLHLVERLAGRELAERTAGQMEYAWRERAQPPSPSS